MKRIAVACLSMILSVGLFAEERSSSDSREEISGKMGKGIYSKPFWRRMGRGTHVGGYIDFNYRKTQNSNGRFDQHRMIPFIYADIAEGIRFATEIEIEHGGPQNNQKNGDVKIEFAVLDYEVFGEKLGLRGGIILSPLGKFNLVHDTPLQDLSDRPRIHRFIIPTTLSESGYGVFGTLYPTEIQKLDYELYLVNGFNGTSTSSTLTAPVGGGTVTSVTTKTQGGAITAAKGLRSARGSQKSDNNNNKALVGRIGYSPLLGYEFGVSMHTGAYDDAANNNLTITALDGAAQVGPFELLGEFAQADLDKDSTIAAATPEEMEGYYIQANYHFLQDVIRQGSTFTAAIRYEDWDTDTSLSNNDKQRITYGINFRPVEDTVFVLDYQVNKEDSAVDNNTVSFGIASYF